MSKYWQADTITRQDVRVSRDGWVTDKRYDIVVGMVTADTNAAGQPIWRAHASDVSSFDFTRSGAVLRVLALHNMHEKARAYDIVSRLVKS